MQSFKRLALFNFSYKIFGALIGLATVALLTKNLAKDDFGFYSFVVSASLLLAAFGQAGTPMFLAREISRSRDKILTIKVLRLSALFITLFLIMLIGLIGFLVSPLQEVEMLEVAIVTMLAVAVAPNNINGAVYRGLGFPTLSLTAEAILRQMIFLSLLLVTIFKYEINIFICLLSYVAASFVSYFVSSVGLKIWINKTFSKLKNERSSLSLLRRALLRMRIVAIGSAPFLLITSYPVINSNIEIFFIAGLGSFEDVASFKVTTSITSILSFGLVAVAQLSIPAFANYKRSNTLKKEAVKQFKQSARLTFSIALLATFLFAVFGDYMVSLAFGPNYEAVYKAVLIMSIGHLVSCYIGPAGLMLNMTNNEATVLRLSIMSLLLNALLMSMLVPKFGVYGAAASSSLTLSLWNVLLRVRIKRRLGF
jgi:O-antigen/teichoic acid export membrane protein